ncbi:MAG: FAD-binding oxidoreductase [Anaerolineae bacterium]|nr:FAD-binding oxidoreductase [Anaerolineae bacterium]MDK1118932.1 FAD-binding oxidoreductase [Anaerolineae bacterium]
METTAFWTDQFPRPAELPVAVELPSRVDVVIIGSGYTGLNAARVLVKSGASVVVLERKTIGWGASSRNGGMATPGLKQSITKIFKRYGPEKGRMFWKASLDAIDLLEKIVAGENLDCDWSRNGHVALAYKPSHFEGMKKAADWFEQKLGYSMQLVSPSDLKMEIGSEVFFGGLADDFSGGLQPAKYVFGLATAVAKQGVALYEQTAVTRISKQSKKFKVEASKGTIIADEVVLATGGYTDRLVPKLKAKVFPVGSYCIVTEPLTVELQKKLSPKGRMFYDSKIFLNYFRLTPDGRMLWGGRNNLSTSLGLEQSARILRQQMVKTFPDLRGVALSHSWTGQLGATFDLMPHIGQVDGLHYALGYNGHGLTIATYLGTELGLLLSGQKTSSPFAEIPHPTMFFYRNKPWFIPLAAQYYRYLDWIS